MPKPFHKSDFKPAVKDPKTGQVWTGEDHREAINNAHNQGNKNIHFENTGFLHKDDFFYTRSQTETLWGFKTSEDTPLKDFTFWHGALYNAKTVLNLKAVGEDLAQFQKQSDNLSKGYVLTGAEVAILRKLHRKNEDTGLGPGSILDKEKYILGGHICQVGLLI